MNPVQKDDQNLNNNQATAVPVVNSSSSQARVSVPHGGVEGQPVIVNTNQESGANEAINSVIEHGPEFAPGPELSGEESNVGVVSHPQQPQVNVPPGVSHSIPESVTPSAPVFKTTFTDVTAAEEAKKSGDVGDSRTWSAVEFLRNFGRNLMIGNKKKSSEI